MQSNLKSLGSNPLRVLISSYGPDRDDIGEAWSAYKWISGLSAFCQITLVTVPSRVHGPGIVQEQLPGVRVIEVQKLPFLRQFPRFDIMAKPSFLCLYRVARQIARRNYPRDFDLCHSLTPNALRFPSPFWGLRVPFIHGPCGGSLPIPAELSSVSGRDPWYVHLRAIDQLRFRCDPTLVGTYRDAAHVVGIGSYVRDIVPNWPNDRASYMNDTGIENEHPRGATRLRTRIPTILFVGRLIPKKGIHLLIDALGRIGQQHPFRCRIVGEGFLMPEIRRQIARSPKLSASVQLLGRIPRSDVFDEYRRADIFCLPSLAETSGNALMEAMSFGLPCIVASNGGPREVVKPECGRQIPIGPRADFVDALAQALIEFLSNVELRDRAGWAAIDQIRRHHLWPTKIANMYRLYERIARPHHITHLAYPPSRQLGNGDGTARRANRIVKNGQIS